MLVSKCVQKFSKSFYMSRNVYSNLKNSPVRNSFFRTLTTHNINFITASNNKHLVDSFINLNSVYKENERIYKQDMESMIKNVEKQDFITEDSISLLQCCGHLMPDQLPSIRMKLAQQLWKTFLNKQFNLNVHHYNTLLQCYIENATNVPHQMFLDEMKCEPNTITYDLLIKCACETGNMKQALEIMNIMKEKELALNEPVFSSLILGHLRCGDVKNARIILETMRITRMTLSSVTYTDLLRGYAEMNDVTQFKSVLTTAASIEFNSKQIISILKSICTSENLELLNLVKKTWPALVSARTFETKLRNLCINLIHSNKPLIAYELFKCFIGPEIGFVTVSDSYGAFLFHEMSVANQPLSVVINIADDLIKTNRNELALIKATECALRIPNIKLSIDLLRILNDRKITLRNHYFWPLLIHEGKQYGSKAIFDIFQLMFDLNVPIEYETLGTYSLKYLQNIEPDLLINYLKQFNLTVTDVFTPLCVQFLRMDKLKLVNDLGLKYQVKLDGRKLIKPLTSAFIKTNDNKNVTNILKNMERKNQSNDFAGQLIALIFTKSINGMDFKQIIDLLNEYKKQNLTITGQYLDKIEFSVQKIKQNDVRVEIQKTLNSLQSSNCMETIPQIPHPRDMSQEELECHLIELRTKRMETRGVLRKLILLHSRSRNLERVLQLWNEFNETGYKKSVGMIAGLLDLFVKMERFDDAWKLYNEIKMNHPTFVIDEHKILDLARLLSQNDQFERAVNLLQNESACRKIKGGKSVERNCWNLLDSIAQNGNANQMKILFKTLVENGYCTETNVILGPIIRVHMNKNDLNEAVDEYVNCCENYGKTPLTQELLCMLVKVEQNTELIQKVIDANAKVHGLVASQLSFLAALAEEGYTKTIRKFFMNSNIQFPSTLVKQICDRWVLNGKIDALNNLIEGARGVPVIDLNVVYLSLMKIYSSNNDFDSAISLWHDIQDHNLTPSSEIQQLIHNLLKAQNHPIVKTL